MYVCITYSVEQAHSLSALYSAAYSTCTSSSWYFCFVCFLFLQDRMHTYPISHTPPAAELLFSPLPAAVSRNAHHLFLPLLFPKLLCHRDPLLYLDRSTDPAPCHPLPAHSFSS